MVDLPSRLLLDTNIFILGYLDPDGPEGRIIRSLMHRADVTLIISSELVAQIRRVARRVGGKDWTGYLLSRIWQDYLVEYVTVSVAEMREMETQSDIPREDVGIFLTALRGQVTCFVSANHELVQQAGVCQRLFESLSPTEFLLKYFPD